LFFIQEKLRPILCPPRLKFYSAEIINCPALRFHADVAVPFHHGPGNMPCQCHLVLASVRTWSHANLQGSIESVKFFTKELWLSAQNLNNLKAYDQEWQQAFDEYRAQLKLLRHRLSDVAFNFFSEGDVHDGELLTLVVTDGSLRLHCPSLYASGKSQATILLEPAWKSSTHTTSLFGGFRMKDCVGCWLISQRKSRCSTQTEMVLETGDTTNSPMPETDFSATRFYLGLERSCCSSSKRLQLAACLAKSQGHSWSSIQSSPHALPVSSFRRFNFSGKCVY
jgi:hypothetical protein